MARRRIYDIPKERVYEAEALCHPGREFESMEDLARWGRTILYVDELFPHSDRPIKFQKAHGNAKSSSAHIEKRVIDICWTMMDEATVLHELAHFTVDNDRCMHHGPEFCWNFLDLTLRWRGVDAYLELRNAFREACVL